MDMHILLSSCNFHEFKYIAFNYMQIEEHPLFFDVKDSMRETGVEMTPAISEIIINHFHDIWQDF
jgi:hypothetical protein